MNSTQNSAPYRISGAARFLRLHPRTLRNYEKAGLVKPTRKGAWRYYSLDDLKWIQCLFEMIHVRGITIAAIGKLLSYAPCWEIGECSKEKRGKCHRYQGQATVQAERNFPGKGALAALHAAGAGENPERPVLPAVVQCFSEPGGRC